MALMMSVKTIISTSVAIIATGAMFACVAPFASADSAQTSAVVSSRSFPKASSVKKNLFAESTSTSVDENSKWGGIETLDVPQTESQGEKEAAAAAAAQKAADEAAAAQSAAAAAASRSEQRASIPQVDLGKMTGTGTGAELASFSLKFQGYPYVAGGNTPAGWDCSGFVQYVFSQFGISLPRTSGAQATVGTPVASLADAKPGDILANGTHAAIYIGNGQVMNATHVGDAAGESTVHHLDGGGGGGFRRQIVVDIVIHLYLTHSEHAQHSRQCKHRQHQPAAAHDGGIKTFHQNRSSPFRIHKKTFIILTGLINVGKRQFMNFDPRMAIF